MAVDVMNRDTEHFSARGLNVILGAWLFISAFLWDHTASQRTNTWIVGILVVAFSLLAMRAPAARFVNTILSVWLFISAFALPTVHMGTVWNNALCAIAVFVVSLTAGDIGDLGYNRRMPRQPI